MYLHQALQHSKSSSNFNHSIISHEDNSTKLLSRSVNRELINTLKARIESKDTISSKLQINGTKKADAIKHAELLVFHQELERFSEAFREDSRTNYLLDQNNKRRDLQETQCVMIGKIESILRNYILESGLDYRKYKVGGYDKGTYERFFRIEPGHFMSKAQFTTALRRSFGDNVIKSQASINKLFDTFDFNRADQMDWRAFLYMLSILMQPHLFFEDLVRWGYAIYSSVGSLDIECEESLSLGMTKDMLCVPVILSLRGELRNAFNNAWTYLSNNDTNTIQYATKIQSTVAARVGDPDDLKITYKILNKILKITSFSKYLEVGARFGLKDTRPVTCYLEEGYYHERILNQLKLLRREERSQREADKFIAQTKYRTKKYSFNALNNYTQKRNFIRYVLIGGEVRSKTYTIALYFSHWKKFSFETTARLLIQRIIRGYLARCRRKFIKRFQKNVKKVQAVTRQMMKRQRFLHKHMQLQWAATTIQRIARGCNARRRVASVIQAAYDTELRMLARKKAAWQHWRKVKAATGIQTLVRRFLRRLKTMRRMAQEKRIQEMEALMSEEELKLKRKEEVYKKELTLWYTSRKEIYDASILTESQTKEQRKAILDRRNKLEKDRKHRLQMEREEKLSKMEEVQADMWNRKWEMDIEIRAKKLEQRCYNVLVLPETPDDLKLKKLLNKKIKTQIKEVLRRADKQKIPMEIPEAFQHAKAEVIKIECDAEIAKGREEMRIEAEKKLKEKEKIINKQIQEKLDLAKKRKKWAAITIQGYSRVFIARRIKRSHAYRRYIKHFDPINHEYFYEDKRTHITTWDKPKSLGSYDVTMDNYWIAMRAKTADGTIIMKTIQKIIYPEESKQQHHYNNYNDNNNENIIEEPKVINIEIPLLYYYNPCTWKQTWIKPEGTIICNNCDIDFAGKLLDADNCMYCESCFYSKAQALVDNGQHPKYVLFKNILGGNENSRFIDLSKTPHENYLMLLLATNPGLKKSEEEEVAEVKKARAKLLRSGKSKDSKAFQTLVALCGLCDDKLAMLTCKQCHIVYCNHCSTIVHSVAAKAFHQIDTYRHHKNDENNVQNDLEDDNSFALPDIYNSNSSKKSKKKSKKSRKHHNKDKNSTIQDSNYLSDDTYTDQSNHSKNKKLKKKIKKRKKDKNDYNSNNITSYSDTSTIDDMYYTDRKDNSNVVHLPNI